MKVLHLFARQTGTRPIHVTIPKRYVYFWEISTYLSARKWIDVKSIDCIDQNYSIFDLSKNIIEDNPQVLIFLVRSENIYQTISFSKFIKTIRSNLKIIVYGDIVNLLPDFFKKISFFDALVVKGDWELSLLSYIQYLKNKNEKILSGVYVKDLKKDFPGKMLGNKWSLPDVKNVPYDFYNRLNGGKQISLTISRGCPYNCSFCLSVCTFGNKDRRKSADDIVKFIVENNKVFDSFKLFSPSFNVDKKWVKEFCNKIINNKIKTSWCATSRIDLLDDERIVKLMKDAGCYKISVGLETINKSSKFLNKEFSKDQIVRVAGFFNKNNITLKGLIMLGVPGQNKNDILEMFRLMRDNNIKIRPTSYSPLNELKRKKGLTVEDIQRYDKFTFYEYGIKGVSKKQYFELVVNPNNFEEILK